MRLGIYIGSFNPVHIGHTHVVNYLLDNNYVDRVLIVPTGALFSPTMFFQKESLPAIAHAVSLEVVD